MSPILHCISILDTRPQWIIMILVASFIAMRVSKFVEFMNLVVGNFPPFANEVGRLKVNFQATGRFTHFSRLV